MQYHWVVMYDSEEGTFEIDWDTTMVMLHEDRGLAFDGDNQEWLHIETGTELSNTYDTLSIHLENTLDKHYTL